MGIDFTKIKNLTNMRPPDRITLDEEQAKAVYSEDKNILVIAAAGSGKTRVLTERIRHLVLDKGVNPESIVAITFTNMAADEMKERLNDIPNINRAFIGTIHSYANSILSATGKRYKLQTDDVVVDYMRSVVIHNNTNSFLSFYTKEELFYNDYSVKEWISYQKSYDEMNKHFIRCLERVSQSNGFRNYCKSRNIISFNELIILSTGVSSTKGKIKHLLVDEFQDICPSEYAFLSGLDVENRFYVGDDWQSIYSFKGSNVGIFMMLANQDDFTTIYLLTNYRSNSDIVARAEEELEGTSVIPKEVKCINEGTDSIEYKQFYQLIDYLRTLDDYKSYFILARRNDTLEDITKRLEGCKIPHVLVSNRELDLASRRSLIDSNVIKLMTIHSSKGLESDNVIVIDDMTRGMSSNLKQEEEEQRVKYVAYTRAKKKLIIVTQ